MPNPASSYQTVVGVQPTPSLALTGNQQSNMANQMQGMMVQYPPIQSYQVSVPQQTYQQPVFVSCQPGQGPVAVSGMQPCYSLLPTNQHTTMRPVSKEMIYAAALERLGVFPRGPAVHLQPASSPAGDESLQAGFLQSRELIFQMDLNFRCNSQQQH
ncbi:hypothetical protein GOODEAATRI_004504 [Goodea atripinnis]|uniref:Uncharacterized protein n=1 Tax=Goodea atripinnis TaxID=208336 RepID=A0ABV0MYN9_9TELE